MVERLAAIDFTTVHPALLLILISTAGALLPLFVLALSSFIKLNIVFSILRNAIGGQNIPPASLVFILSIVLTIQIMGPVWAETGTNLVGLAAGDKHSDSIGSRTSLQKKNNRTGIASLKEKISGEQLLAAFNPLLKFLLRNSGQRERIFFAKQGSAGPAAGDSSPGAIAGETVFTIIPAFLITEVSEAFTIGFIIYVPFLVIDLVVSNILLSLGMMMINPTTISLPVKLVLFIVCDGWLHLVQGLILGYAK